MSETLEVLDLEGFLNLLEYYVGTEQDISGIDFNDTITKIEHIGDIDTIDIEVDGDHLYYANNILTHNSGYGNKDAGMENVSDSMGIAMTADTFCILIRTKEMDEQNQVVFNFVKNRNTGSLTSAIVGVDFPKMRFYDLEQIPDINISPIEQASKFDFGANDLFS